MSQEQADTKRSKYQLEGKREFGCPCGKTYLSYPALFTHVKQKHDGRAPGHLIKPRTEKARGRPKIHIDVPEDDMSDGAFNLHEEIEVILEDVQINYNETFARSEGNRTCQDMASQFFNKLIDTNSEGLKVINCFLNYLKFRANQHFGANFWTESKPNDLIDIVNSMCRTHQQHISQFPIEQQTLVDLTHVLFRWMYKSKWTDHKLIKREPVKKLI